MKTLFRKISKKLVQLAISSRPLRIYILLLALCLLPFVKTKAHGGEDHSKKGSTSSQKPYFSVEGISEKHELLLRYEPFDPNKEVTLMLFASEYLTNKALDSIDWKISSPQDKNMKFIIQRIEKGVYTIKTKFADKKNYTLTFQFTSSLGHDLIALPNIEAGKALPTDEVSQDSILSNQTLVFVVGLLTGLFIMFTIMKLANRKVKAAMMVTIMIWQVLLTQISFAHEGHDDNKGGNNFSNSFEVPKETQFLFNAVTEPLKRGNFSSSTKLFGTVIPSSNGQALIQTPQTGRINSLHIQVGQKVTKGQLLAVIEQTVDAATQASFTAERNNVEAELVASKKEYERLKSIEDIAAKRDVTEAEARYQKAQENKKLYDNLANGKTDVSKMISFRSPINGFVGNFTYAVGSSINAGETLFTITNLAKVYIEAQVYDKDASQVNAAKSFTVICTTDDHKTADVRLLAKAQTINPSNQSQRVLFEMENTGEDFKIGEFVNVMAFTGSPSRELSIPNSAITEVNGRPVVFIKDAAEQFSVSYVSLGHDNGSSTLVLKGAEEGERIITNATYQLKMIYLNQ